MKKYIADEDGKVIDSIEATPVCQQDFCDTCGDCLYCYSEDKCYHNKDGEHFWVEYL